jgi:hypothetical protein
MNGFAIVEENVQEVETEDKASRPRKDPKSSLSGSVCVYLLMEAEGGGDVSVTCTVLCTYV